MIRFSFGVEDSARTRFAISPMLELVTDLRVLRGPGQAAMHVPGARMAMPSTALRDAGLVAATPQGHSVLYARTLVGEQLVAAPPPRP